ncbi:MAG: cellulase family glycosylhydrolase, partial [Clostridium sp.]
MNKKKIKIGILVIFIFVIPGVISYKYIERRFDNNRKTSFHKCINIVNVFEAPKDSPWYVTMKAEYFDVIKDAGFDSIRLPIRFSDYVDKETYIFDKEFINEMDYFIDYALQDNL